MVVQDGVEESEGRWRGRGEEWSWWMKGIFQQGSSGGPDICRCCQRSTHECARSGGILVMIVPVQKKDEV